MKINRKLPNEEETKQIANLKNILKLIWSKKGNYSYNLSYGFKKNGDIYYSFYIYPYTINANGERVYIMPKKIYRDYESMKDYLKELLKERESQLIN